MSRSASASRFPRNFSIVFTLVFLALSYPVLLGIQYHGLFFHLEDLWQDELFRLQERTISAGDPRIIIAAMDEDTGKKYRFPLPRPVHARLLDKLKTYGVKTVAFDVMFLDPMDNDRELVDATRRFGKVVHLFTTRAQDTPHGQVVDVNLPIKGLLEASQYLGYPNIDLVIDNDGHVRRSRMFDKRASDQKNPELIAPSMDVVAAASFLDKPVSDFLEEYATPEPMDLLINFRRPQDWLLHQKRDESAVGKVVNLPMIASPYQMISVMDLLSGELTAAQKKALRGSLVIVGSTSLGYFDHYPTPFISQAPGVEYHANNIDNLLHDDYLQLANPIVTLLVIVFMIWLPLLLLRFPPAVGNVAAGAVFFGWLAYTYFGRFANGVRAEFVAPAVALIFSFLVQTVHRVLTEGQEKKFIKNLFGQFVAPEVVEDLAKDPSKVKLGGEKRDLTIFFLDIAHFTTISEKMAPEALIIFLNKYLSALSNVVQAEKGVVDKYIGDCIMAFWNAPIELKDHRVRACLAAIQCQEVMKTLNLDLDPTLPFVPAIRIGLNSGDATVGLTGSEKKLQYTVIGDEVNLASRLEGANKFFGSNIMASEATFNGARDVVEARELGRVRVVGKAVPIRVFELLARKGQLSAEWKKALPLYEKGVAHFNKREFPEAMAAFQEVVAVFPKDGPANLYLTVSTDYSVIPPPEDWDGVFNLTAK